jgi:hypothetical protein
MAKARAIETFRATGSNGLRLIHALPSVISTGGSRSEPQWRDLAANSACPAYVSRSSGRTGKRPDCEVGSEIELREMRGQMSRLRCASLDMTKGGNAPQISTGCHGYAGVAMLVRGAQEPAYGIVGRVPMANLRRSPRREAPLRVGPARPSSTRPAASGDARPTKSVSRGGLWVK